MTGFKLNEQGTDSKGRKLYTLESQNNGGSIIFWEPWWGMIPIILFTTSGILALGLFLCYRNLKINDDQVNSNYAIITGSILHLFYIYVNHEIGRDYNPFETGYMFEFVLLRLIIGGIAFSILNYIQIK